MSDESTSEQMESRVTYYPELQPPEIGVIFYMDEDTGAAVQHLHISGMDPKSDFDMLGLVSVLESFAYGLRKAHSITTDDLPGVTYE